MIGSSAGAPNCQGESVVAVPGGTETFVFTDIEDSTGLLRASSDERYHALQAHAHELVRRAFAVEGGREIGSAGDGLFFVFPRARAALAAALHAQRALALEDWPPSCELRVRMGMHTGEAVVDEDLYTGLDVNVASRICGLARGGEVLVSDTTALLVEGSLPEGAVLIDTGRHELRGAGPRRLHRLQHPDLSGLAALPDAPSAVPTEVTTFIGREASIVDAQRALASSPLVTLIGPGGVGKTRLAGRVARELASSYADGIAFVDLASATDEPSVVATIAGAVGAQELPAVTLLEAIISHLQGRRMLLVLDNAEHVAAGCAAATDRLVEGTSVSILVTSRVALKARAEILVPVEPLTLPHDGRAPDESEAVRLFVDRARRVRRPFTLDESNASAVATICRQLDGLPLGIELAAARVRLLTAEQIAEELRDSIATMRETGAHRPARHRSLVACIDWSFGLLEPAARLLVQRLSVFAGGFDLDAAVAVCGGDDLVREQVLDGLLVLVDASLVSVDGAGGRLRMLDTIRVHAATAVTTDDALRDRHLSWVVELASSIGRDDEPTALRRLDADHANVLTALEWALERGRGDLALRVLAAAWLVFLDHTRSEGVVEVTRAALAMDEAGPSPDRLYVLLGFAFSASGAGDIVTALAAVEEAGRVAAVIGDATGIAWAQNARGWIALMLHEPGARQHLDPAVEHARTTQNHRLLADALIATGMTKALTGQPRDGVVDLEEAVAEAARGGLTVGFRPAALTFLGAARLIAGDLFGALRSLNESAEAMQNRPRARHWFHTPFTTTLRTVTAVMMGRVDEAIAAASPLLLEERRVAHPLARSILDAGAGMAAQWSGQLGHAREAFTQSLVFTTDPFWAAWARHGLVELSLVEHDLPGAKAHLDALRRGLVGVGDAFHECRADVVAGDLARAERDIGEAVTRYSHALQRSVEAPMHIVTVEALEGLAGALTVRQELELSGRLLGAADGLRARIGYARCPSREALVDEVARLLSEAFGPEGADLLRSQGSALDLDEVLVLALAGRGARRSRARAGWGSLTRAEQNVAVLVGRGMSNPDIAQRLFISRRTVERHVSNIFTKTGITSRSGLAAEVARRADHDEAARRSDSS